MSALPITIASKPSRAPALRRRLPDGIYAAQVDEDLVFLDTTKDAYVCLPDAMGHIAVLADGSGLEATDAAILIELQQAGLVAATDAGPMAPRRRPISPNASAVRDTYSFPRWIDLWDAGVAMVDLARCYRGQSFAQLLAHAGSAAPVGPCDRARMLSLVDRFHRWIPYAPVSGKCLLRAFMLRRFLQRHGCDADWVFGVSTWPFRAHCWLQWDDIALDDHPDRLAVYTPILVL